MSKRVLMICPRGGLALVEMSPGWAQSIARYEAAGYRRANQLEYEVAKLMLKYNADAIKQAVTKVQKERRGRLTKDERLAKKDLRPRIYER